MINAKKTNKKQAPNLVLKVVIHRGTLVLCHALLLAVHFGNLPTCCSRIGLLIITHADEARESETDALIA